MKGKQEAIKIYESYLLDGTLWKYEAIFASIVCVDKIISVLEESNAAVGSLQFNIILIITKKLKKKLKNYEAGSKNGR